jgi:hypothetical protein
VVITNRQAEAALLALPVGATRRVCGRDVRRLDRQHWAVDDDPEPLMLLRAIDATWADDADQVRFPAEYRGG